MDEGVRAGTLKPSRDPKARANYLAITGGGGFLLYIQMHDTPTDLRAVLHDYAQDMVLPALEVYTNGLLTDSTMYDAFLARQTRSPLSRRRRTPMTTQHVTPHRDRDPRTDKELSVRCARSTAST